MYDYKKIEQKWKKRWFKDNIYEAVDFSKKPKKYILAELPYPSGKFLHAGHMMRYTVPEIYSRFLRMQGYNVMFPMGWDSFGLPPETYAIKEGITPEEAIEMAIKEYKPAMQAMGYAIDWSREFTTSKPDYYKWTQWIFLKLWEAGLAVEKEMPVWWCKELGVLADEEVLPDGENPDKKVSERGSYPVERKVMKQWVLTIPTYADKLLDGLYEVEWPESIKTMQREWIGRKEGINIDYHVVDSEEVLTCFTTTPVNWGATFIVVAPEHPFAQKVAEENKQVSEYISHSMSKSELERQENKTKTGVFTDKYVLNHVTEQQIPIWVSDFVLMNFGTGAVQGCPGHDLRDFEFAKTFGIKITRVVIGENRDISEIDAADKIIEKGTKGTMTNSDFLNGMDFEEAMERTMDYFEEKGWGKRAVTYKLRDQIWSRQRYWGDPIPLIYKQDGSVEADYNLPVVLPQITAEKAAQARENKEFPPLKSYEDWVQTKDNKGNPATRESDTMPTWAGSNWYYLRYIDPHNDKEFADQEKLKYWLPVDNYFGGSEHTTVHLLYSRFWHRVLYDQGLVPTKEPYAKRLNGGLLLGSDGRKMSKRWGNIINPADIVENYGADATRTYIAFIGPYIDTYPWDNNGIKACFRLANSVYELKAKVSEKQQDEALTHFYHKMVKKVTKMCEELKMNTAVAEFMKFTNEAKKASFINKDIYLGFIRLFAPFAPFVTEEIWQEVNNYEKWQKENSVHLQTWPEFDDNLAKEDTVVIGIQINGKVRGEIEVALAETEESVRQKALADEGVKKHIDGKEIKKFVYVPGRIVSIVV